MLGAGSQVCRGFAGDSATDKLRRSMGHCPCFWLSLHRDIVHRLREGKGLQVMKPRSASRSASLTEAFLARPVLKIRLDFRRRVRIALGVGRRLGYPPVH